MTTLMFALHIAIIGALSFRLWKQEKQWFFWPALVFKLIAGISLGLLYQYYYTTGDTWAFFNDATKMADALVQTPSNCFSFFWQDDFSAIAQPLENNRPRSMYLVKWVAAFNLLNGNNYWITSLYFSFISFFSSWVLYRTLIKYFPDLQKEAALSFLFIPSIVFWGSGIIKESLAIAGLFGISACFISWYCGRAYKVSIMLIGLICFWVLWNLKYYWVAVWLAVMMPLVLIGLLKERFSFVSRYPKLIWFLFMLLAGAGISLIHPNFYFDQLLTVIVENNEAYLKLSNSENIIHFHELTPTLSSMLINSPWALLSGIFRPFIFEAGNALQAGAAIENFILLALLIMSMVKLPKLISQITELHLAFIAFIILLSVFLALSTPNLGSLSRFRVGFTPVLWFALLATSGILKTIRLRLK